MPSRLASLSSEWIIQVRYECQDIEKRQVDDADAAERKLTKGFLIDDPILQQATESIPRG
jgi:hypothetical protein